MSGFDPRLYVATEAPATREIVPPELVVLRARFRLALFALGMRWAQRPIL